VYHDNYDNKPAVVLQNTPWQLMYKHASEPDKTKDEIDETWRKAVS
jgi:hypothetical protein